MTQDVEASVNNMNLKNKKGLEINEMLVVFTKNKTKLVELYLSSKRI